VSPLSALRVERDRFVALAFSWADLLFELDPDGRIVYAAGAVEPFLGRKNEALVGESIEKLAAPAERGLLTELLASARKRERIEGVSVRLLGERGVTPPLAIAGYQLHDLNGHFFLGLRYSAGKSRFGRRPRDEESGLIDGDGFIDMVTSYLAEGESDDSRAMSLLVLPRFDDLRSRLVDAAEKELLVAIGACLKENSVNGEAAARLASDRFGVMHGPDTDVDALRAQIATLTKKADPLNQGSPVETATIDVDAEAIGDEQAIRGVVYTLNRFRNLRSSDHILDGLSNSISALARRAADDLSRLRDMINRQDFEIHFQPVLNVRSGAVNYYETLSRVSSEYGAQSIYEQVTFAEETGLITAFDLAVLQKLLKWMESNTARNAKTCFGINVSGQSVGSLSYLAQVDRLLKASPWLRGRLLFEITESARISDPRSTNGFVQRLREQGFRVALDDFGAGAANFEYLANLEVDMIKLDGHSVIAATKARHGRAFVKALVAFAREMSVGIAAEMIEDESVLEFARDCGVQFVQGYLFGKPRRDLKAIQEGLPNQLFPERLKFNSRAAPR
jgi:PAS domain S-box-containing protein